MNYREKAEAVWTEILKFSGAPNGSVGVIERALREVRREAIEEALKVCEEAPVWTSYSIPACDPLMEHIRALLDRDGDGVGK